jgi:hypothetical protein
VRLLQSSVAIGRMKRRRRASKPDFGEQPRNQWKSRDRAKCKKLIAKKLGEIPETKAIVKLLKDAIAPSDVRNRLAHGTWWSFDPQTATIGVRGGIQRKGETQFAYYTEMCIRATAEKFETLEAELYKRFHNGRPSRRTAATATKRGLPSSPVNCVFLDNRKQKYWLLRTSGGHNGNLRVLVCDIYHF